LMRKAIAHFQVCQISILKRLEEQIPEGYVLTSTWSESGETNGDWRTKIKKWVNRGLHRPSL